jgi:arylsulfatase A-like enzyme/Tfp pilus assembly protein PilF
MAQKKAARRAPRGGRPARFWRGWRFLLIMALVSAAVVAAAAAGWRYARVSAPPSGPVVLISIDTLRADHLPIYGYQQVATPAIDALAADGIVFDRAYAHGPQTLPSHVSILSGDLPFQTGVRDNIGFTVPADLRLLPEMLHARGFRTAGFVSGYVIRKETGLGRAFDVYDSDMPASSPELSVGQVRRDGGETVAAAERWLDTQRSPRLFLFLHLYDVHKPYVSPDRYSQYAPYDGAIAYADEHVGRFIAYLKAHDLYDRALIILLSDHGEGLGDHGEQEHGLFLYDETIRVPLVIKLPREAGAHRRIATPVQHIDLVPTVLDFFNVPRPRALAGRSLRSLLEGTSTRLPEQGFYAESLYSRYHFGWSELESLTDSRYRYIRAPHEELYDLQQDPGERQNVADRHAQTDLAMREALERVTAGSTIHAPSQASDEERERLAALGYVGTGPRVAAEVAGDTLPDPKDKVQVLEVYRRASDLAGQRRFADATVLYRQILKDDPEMADVWLQLAEVMVRMGQTSDAVDAYKHVLKLNPTDAGALIGAAGGLLRLRRLDEAKAHAEAAVEGAPAAAHELLTKIALRRGDTDEARKQAELARQADPTLPMPLYVQAMQLYKAGKYAEALPIFEEALQLMRARTLQMNEIHFYTGNTLARLERCPEAEAEFKEEIRIFPHNLQARTSLAMLYRATNRHREADQAIADLLRVVPTAEAYALASRLSTIFGEQGGAAKIRADGVRKFGEPAMRRAIQAQEKVAGREH